MDEVVICNNEVVGIINYAGNLQCVKNGKSIKVAINRAVISVIESPGLYKQYYDAHYGDITRQEIQDRADRNKVI